MTWNSEKQRWEIAFPYDMDGSTKTFRITSVHDNIYDLTAINDAVGEKTVSWACIEMDFESSPA